METYLRRRSALILLCTMILGFSSILYASSSFAAPAPPCIGTSCNGKSPVSDPDLTPGQYSCSTPPPEFSVYDIRTATAPVGGLVMTTILRYSTWCQAYWAVGIYGPINGLTNQWRFTVQVTTRFKQTMYSSNPVLAPRTDAYTDMYAGPAEACVQYIAPSPSYRLCTRQVRLEFMGTVAPGKVGTDCNNPAANPAPNNWHFRVVGLNPTVTNRANKLDDGVDGVWLNPVVNGCPAPYRWPLFEKPIVINGAFGGLDLYVAAWPDTNTPGALPPLDRLYTANILLSAGGSISPTYQRQP